MKKLLILWASLLLLFTNTIAQNILPPVYEIKTDTALINTVPTSHWQILEDKDGKLSFDQVSNAPMANRFHYYNSKANKADFTIHGYWFRYILKNAMDHDAKIFLGDPRLNDESDFYLLYTDGKISHKINGALVPWDKLDGVKGLRAIPVELIPGEQVSIYNRIYNTYHFNSITINSSQVAFYPQEKAMQIIYAQSQTNYFNAIHDVFIVGVLAFASLFIFMFFIIIREKAYLYFSLYLLALSIGRFNTYYEMYDVFFRQFQTVYRYFLDALWFFPTFFLIHFIRHLLNTKNYLPKWNKFLVFFSLAYALTYATFLIVKYADKFSFVVNAIVTLEQIIISLSIPVTFFMSLKRVKQNKILTYVVLPLQSIWSISWSIAIFSLAFKVNTIGWLQANWFGFETILFCCLVISFSWILLNRFGELKKQIVQKELEKEIERSRLIETQKVELEEQVADRTSELKHSLNELKTTQSQLIQSEKMASLGELTAGIAHEIQNPLNFVNNFSDVNKELLVEMKDEMEKGNLEEVKAIASDVIDNEEKINHHGKRADAIVKNMLQHSRASSGKKEPTNINALCDEYLRLAYHGLRAKDKSFNAITKTDFDNSIGKINIVPQDIGRVVLNLINNAFYAVDEKKKSMPPSPKGEEEATSFNYEPTVTVSTKRLGPPLGDRGKIEIRVADNGNGIPHKVLDKIFQPFFTTKPTGQGTGLGLSLSYDIVKAHGGELKVETRENDGSIFIIQLPI